MPKMLKRCAGVVALHPRLIPVCGQYTLLGCIKLQHGALHTDVHLSGIGFG
jgi:hypothetical protein